MTIVDWPALQDWFRREGIEYPWGENPDPYRVWISEIMLQQTQVKAVIPYFLHWMDRYPDLPSLAVAHEDEVLRSWEGLGYYSRARNIHRCAKVLQEKGESRLPEDYQELLALPGIGPYTAAAICSIAFKQNYPVMDANVKRLCQRWGAHLHWTKDLENSWTDCLKSIIQETGSPGEFNCALMQFGQIFCKKGQPKCDGCPLNRICQAYKEGLVNKIPSSRKKEIQQWDSRVLIFLKDGCIFLERRNKGIGKGLWSLPRIPKAQPLPKGWDLLGELRQRAHHFTTNKENLFPVVLKATHINPMSLIHQFPQTEWVSLSTLREKAVPSIYRTILEELIQFLKH